VNPLVDEELLGLLSKADRLAMLPYSSLYPSPPLLRFTADISFVNVAT
jgi:hypothetical protein